MSAAGAVPTPRPLRNDSAGVSNHTIMAKLMARAMTELSVELRAHETQGQTSDRMMIILNLNFRVYDSQPDTLHADSRTSIKRVGEPIERCTYMTRACSSSKVFILFDLVSINLTASSITNIE